MTLVRHLLICALDFGLGKCYEIGHMPLPEIDRPSTWKAYKTGMCVGCHGGCCTMPVEVTLADLIRLGVTDEDEVANSLKKVAKRLKKEGIISSYRQGTDLFMLTQKSNRDCYYLDKNTRLCTVYEKRPGVCRSFPSIGPRPGFCPCYKANV